MPRKSAQSTPVERCQLLLEKTITALAKDDYDGTITVVGDQWSEQLTSSEAGVSLWARLDKRGIVKVDMRESEFLKYLQALAHKGPGVEGSHKGVIYKFQLFSEFEA